MQGAALWWRSLEIPWFLCAERHKNTQTGLRGCLLYRVIGDTPRFCLGTVQKHHILHI